MTKQDRPARKERDGAQCARGDWEVGFWWGTTGVSQGAMRLSLRREKEGRKGPDYVCWHSLLQINLLSFDRLLSIYRCHV